MGKSWSISQSFCGHVQCNCNRFLTYKLYTTGVNQDKPLLVIQQIKPFEIVYNIGEKTAYQIRVVTHFNKQADDITPFDVMVSKDGFTFAPPNKLATGIEVQYENVHGKKYITRPNLELQNSAGFQLSDAETDIVL